MRKLLLAVGNKEPHDTTLDFACYLARLTGSGLTGIFLETLKHDERLVTSIRNDELHMAPVPYTGMAENRPVRMRCDGLISRFKNACASRGVTGQAHRDRGVPWNELLTECRYADAIIVDADFSLHAGSSEASPTHQVKKLLHEAECPVIVAPLSFGEPMEEIIMAYDGSASSVYAIRQFVHLFPELGDRKAVVLEIRADDEQHCIDEKYRLKEWLKNYLAHIEFVLLQGYAEDRLLEYLLSRPRALVVMGGYGRGRLSRLLQPSTSAAVVRLLPSPLFITHH